jgi:catechol 2,3-dioxygenase-like lactoylglutathione lyase family enzyme
VRGIELADFERRFTMLSKSRVSATLPFRGLNKAQAFYGDNLGLELVSGSVKEGYLEYSAGDGTTLQLFESTSKKSDDTAATFDVEDLDSEMTTLREKGVVFEEYDLPDIKTEHGVATMDGHRGAWFKDPGGNVLCLHEGK